MESSTILKGVLRFFGTSSLLGAIFVFVPDDVMNEIHGALGLGELPDAPIVGYLARSTSAFYAMIGGLLWLVSFDLPRYRPVLKYVGGAITALGLALYVIDFTAGFPTLWSVWEGTVVTALGLTISVSSRRIPDLPR